MPASRPDTDPAFTAYVTGLASRAEALHEELAHALLTGAAYVAVHVFGASADRLLVAEDENDNGETDIVPLVLFDAEDTLLWVNDHDYLYDSSRYPGAAALLDQHGHLLNPVDNDLINQIADYLEAGYDQVGGCSGALDPEQDDFFGPGTNVLVLDIPAALEPWGATPTAVTP